uniref:Uncharacterized protein n=1 Tax=Arundo donax TaxID=35708 RepID=A0A0A8Z2Z2_ARUDO
MEPVPESAPTRRGRPIVNPARAHLRGKVFCSAPVARHDLHVPVAPYEIKIKSNPSGGDTNPTNAGDASAEEGSDSIIVDLMKMYGVPNLATRYGGEWNWEQMPTIYIVPMELKRGDENKCYDPVAVQIGLCRNYRFTLELDTDDLQRYKACCVQQLISRHSHLHEPDRTPAALLDGCFESMKSLYPKIRACHSKRITFRDKSDVARTMLLDGCFILHRLLKYARLAESKAKGSEEDSDVDHLNDDDWTQVIGRCCVWQLVTRDLLLLQNQIPFFVLRELFCQLKNDEPEDTIVKGSLMLFRSLCPQMLRPTGSGSVSAIAPSDVHHLLHLFYLSVGFPSGENDRRPSRRQADVLPSELPQWIPGAKELDEAGVRFRKRKNASTFLDIKFDFHSGVLEIPPLQLYDYSDALFRNLIAFEQTYPGTRFDITTYCVFMNCLINTREDMRILHLRGILVNMMNGEQDASRFFNRICSQVHFLSENYLVELMGNVSKYKDSRRHKWRAALVRNYFSNPWVAISVVAAVLLLGMAVVQTFFTVYPYFKPRN